jgi:hypothetical protein
MMSSRSDAVVEVEVRLASLFHVLRPIGWRALHWIVTTKTSRRAVLSPVGSSEARVCARTDVREESGLCGCRWSSWWLHFSMMLSVNDDERLVFKRPSDSNEMTLLLPGAAA